MLFLIFSYEEAPAEKCTGTHFRIEPYFLRDGTALVVQAERQAEANMIGHRALKFYGIPEDYRKIMSIPLGLAAGMDVRCSIFGTNASGKIAFRGICKISKAGDEP